MADGQSRRCVGDSWHVPGGFTSLFREVFRFISLPMFSVFVSLTLSLSFFLPRSLCHAACLTCLNSVSFAHLLFLFGLSTFMLSSFLWYRCCSLHVHIWQAVCFTIPLSLRQAFAPLLTHLFGRPSRLV